MSTHSIRYIIDPPSACPAALLNSLGRPRGTCDVDTDQVALCAAAEVFQTGPTAASLSALFEGLLVPSTSGLIWRDRGPGRGIEMRRALSGLLGRFFARAYLQRYHGFVWFAPIDGVPAYVSNRYRIRRRRGRKVDLPDWVCTAPGTVALAEAKGSHQKGNATRGGRPGPIKTAAQQIGGVVLQRRTGGGTRRWANRSVKGWAVMSRWGIETPSRDAFHWVLDPETIGDPLSDEERVELEVDVARSHVELLLQGLGHSDVAADIAAGHVAPTGRVRPAARTLIHGETDRSYLGTVIGPLGVLGVSIAEAMGLVSSLPPTFAQSFRFIGLDTETVRRARTLAATEIRAPRAEDDGTRIGPDGMIIAPLHRIAPTQISI